MDWKINKGIISNIFIDGKDVIYPWGFETSDSFSFFSQTTGGNRNTKTKDVFSSDEKKNSGEISVTMKEGSWNLKVGEEKSKNNITREHALMFEEDSYVFDYVQRYRFQKKYFEYATIADKKIYHTNSNVYYQYPVNEVSLYGPEIQANISLLEHKGSKFIPHMYVRDYKDEWVVHVRLMPRKWDKEVIKLCTFWYNKAIPQFLSDFFLRSDFIKKTIWLRGERKPYRKPFSLLSPNAYPEVLMKKGEKLYLKSKCDITGV